MPPLDRKPLINKVHLGPKLVGDADADTAKRLADAMPYIGDSSKAFAKSLIQNQSMYGWSDKQRHWAGVLLDQARIEYRARRAEQSAAQLNDLLDKRVAAVSNPAMAMLERLFKAAEDNKGKRAPMLLCRVDGKVARIKRGNSAAFVLYWNDAAPGQGYLGSVDATGIVKARDGLASKIAAALNRFADPAAAARLFSKETATCMCCARTLDHPVSVKYGIGPICNARWNVYPSGEYVLPKGEKVGG